MASIYESFLNAPSASALTPNASLHYITTTTSIHEATAIIKHIQAQDKLVKKKSETIISKIASGNSIVLETENSYEFVRGGGALLPQMDDNMLVDSLVTLPMVSYADCDSNVCNPTGATRADRSVIGAHCPARLERQDQPDPHPLGPGYYAQTGRRHWTYRSQLANPRG